MALLLAAAKASVGFFGGSIAILSDMLASFANLIFLTVAAFPRVIITVHADPANRAV
jgi:divalent metal cation (Fe/Co/Zn/Cd) transporter